MASEREATSDRPFYAIPIESQLELSKTMKSEGHFWLPKSGRDCVKRTNKNGIQPKAEGSSAAMEWCDGRLTDVAEGSHVLTLSILNIVGEMMIRF